MKQSRFLWVAVCLAAFVSLGTFVSCSNAGEWKLQPNPIYTPWAEQVNPEAPLPEYPRPQLVRSDWKSLNGLWEYVIAPKAAANGPVDSFDGKILVPYPIESALSGVKKEVGPDNQLIYQRTFELPGTWSGKRILLNFEAVDWKAWVYVNDKLVGEHTGGYAPFCCDITDALTDAAVQTLRVVVYDPTDANWQPRGKQVRKPGGIWYTSVTGIWGSVWLEPVDKSAYLADVWSVSAVKEDGKLVPTLENQFVAGYAPKTGDASVSVKAFDKDGRQVAAFEAPVQANNCFQGNLKIERPNLWTPDSPYLYKTIVELYSNGKVVDTAESYFGVRTSTLGKTEDGLTRVLLNGKFLFQYGPLDQGWWPDGLYTAPTDEALKFDLVSLKKMGFNMLRKHVKVEPRRYYYHCDVLGMLVWQDMPSGDKYIGPKDPDIVRCEESAKNYYHEWGEIIETLRNSPSIVMWVPFNEGWGQFSTDEVTAWTKKLDPTRLVNCTSGWAWRTCGDIQDMHSYPGPNRPEVEENRAIVLGEFGGLGLPCKGNAWKEQGNWGYVSFDDKDALYKRYSSLITRLHALIPEGLSAAVYTQTTDVEIEVNGLFSYDRKIDKMGVERVYSVNSKLYRPAPKLECLVPTSKDAAQVWKYSFDKPAGDWAKPEFDDSAWKSGEAGFGTKMTPNTSVRTEWSGTDIWLRKTFKLDEIPDNLALSIYYDEDTEVYINGVKVLSVEKYVTSYTTEELGPEAVKALKKGENVIAVHTLQTIGGQYIDLGLDKVVEQK